MIKKKKTTEHEPTPERSSCVSALDAALCAAAWARAWRTCVWVRGSDCRCAGRSFFFFFKQKTAYEISTRDWSSDVCSSDLPHPRPHRIRCARNVTAEAGT